MPFVLAIISQYEVNMQVELKGVQMINNYEHVMLMS